LEEERTLLLETAKVLQINVICLDFNSLVEIIVEINYGNNYGNANGNNYGDNCYNDSRELSLIWGLADSIIDQKVRKKVCIAGEKA
jgi:hypothetical protein